MPEKSSSGDARPTTISFDMVAEVERLAVPGDLFVDGSVSGGLEVAGRLVIREGAVVRGTVTAQSVIVAGAVEGDIVARDDLKLMSSGSVSGSVCATNVTVEQGARCSALIASGGRSTPTDDRKAAEGRYRSALERAASATGRAIEPSAEYEAWAGRPPIVSHKAPQGPLRSKGTPISESDVGDRRGWSKSVRDATVASRTARELELDPTQPEATGGEKKNVTAWQRTDELVQSPEISELFDAPSGEESVDPEVEDASTRAERKPLDP